MKTDNANSPQRMDEKIIEIQRLEERILTLKRSLVSSGIQGPLSTTGNDTVDFLLIRSSGHTYAAPLGGVVEVVEMPRLMALPRPLTSIRGIVNYHGTLLAVVDIEELSGKPKSPVSATQILVICTSGDRQFAIKADEALEVVTADATRLVISDSVLPGIMKSCGLFKMSENDTAVVIDFAWISTGAALSEITSNDAITPIDS